VRDPGHGPEASTTGDQTTVGPLGALAFRDFRLFWASSISHGVSRYMWEMLNYYLVYELSGSALKLGLTGLFQTIPVLVLGLFAGGLADAVNRKRLLVLTQSLSTLPSFLVAALVATGNIQVWHLWAITSFSSAVGIFGRPAQRALLPQLVPAAYVLNAITLHSAPSQGTLMIGPVLAGVLVDEAGLSYAYLVNGLFQLIGLILFVAIRTSGEPEGPRRRVSVRTLVEGVRFVGAQKILLASMLLDFGVMAVGFYRLLFPVLAKEVFGVGATGLGLLNASPAVGAVLGSLTLLVLGNVQRKGALVVLSYVVYGGALGLLGVSSVLWIGVLAAGILGYADILGYTARQALYQLAAADQFRGRVNSIAQILANLGNSSGAMTMGTLATLLGGASAAVLTGAGLTLGMVLAIHLRWRQLWACRL
jgi:MFS family permease